MLQLTNIKGTDLFIIEVPEEARNYEPIVFDDNYEFIGTVTKDSIDTLAVKNVAVK